VRAKKLDLNAAAVAPAGDVGAVCEYFRREKVPLPVLVKWRWPDQKSADITFVSLDSSGAVQRVIDEPIPERLVSKALATP
jgi:hypothetical protein